MSQRPFQPPAVRTSHDGASHAMPTPSRWAISVAVSMSKPSYLPVFLLSDDCGGYAGSVETVIFPRSQTCASRPPAALSVWQTLPPAAALGAALPLSSSPPHAATDSVSRASTDRAAAEDLRMTFLLLRRHDISPGRERCHDYLPPGQCRTPSRGSPWALLVRYSSVRFDRTSRWWLGRSY
jgi:hypothetical protein